VTDIVKGVLSGSWALVAGWVLPVGLAIAVFGVMVLPSLGEWSAFAALDAASATEKGVVLLVVSVAIGLTLSTLSTPLYRILEGYSGWPAGWPEKRIAHHRKQRTNLHNQVTKTRDEPSGSGVIDALALEKFSRYPDNDDQVAPTMLGNAIRRFEYYALDRYQLDSQLCWYHLRAAAPESMGKEVDNARSGVDFFVCLLYMLILLAFSALIAMFTPSPKWFPLVIIAVLSGAGVAGSYQAAVKATDAWSSSVKAMVDIGRIALANALGLQIPDTLADEREMWQQVNWLLGFEYKPKAVTGLDPYRQSMPGAPPHKAGSAD
jgi:hypothetical protein